MLDGDDAEKGAHPLDGLPVALAAGKRLVDPLDSLSLDHLLKGVPLAVLVGAPFEWQEGWLYELTGDAESTASRSVET